MAAKSAMWEMQDNYSKSGVDLFDIVIINTNLPDSVPALEELAKGKGGMDEMGF